MRTRLSQVLGKEDRDEPMDAVVRRFWSHGSRSAPQAQGPVEARVIDLAAWVSARAARARQ
jgi:hypothetical protein